MTYSNLQNIPRVWLDHFHKYKHNRLTGCGTDDSNLELFWRTHKNGVSVVFVQCMNCGNGEATKTVYVEDIRRLPRWSYSQQEAIREAARPEWEAKLEIEKAARAAERKRAYEEYLKSEAWREKRRLVIKRSGGICEECENAPVEHVHHITYERLCNEDLGDLLGVCISCHEAIHGRPIR